MVEIFSKSQDIKKAPFEAAQEVDKLKVDGLTDTEMLTRLQEEKAKFKENIAKINSRLTQTLDTDTKTWLQNLLDPSLDNKEYDLVISDTERRLKEIQENFDLALRGSAARAEDTHSSVAEKGNEMAIDISTLNSQINSFLTGELENMIEQADVTDADSAAYAHRMNPPEEKKEEVQVAEKNEDKGSMPAPSMEKIRGRMAKLNDALKGNYDNL